LRLKANLLHNARLLRDVLPEEFGEPQKTVFGLPNSWISEGQIKEEHLSKIKKICTELSLEPSGFVVISEAIAHLVKSEEGAPVNAVVLGIGKESLDFLKFIIEKNREDLLESILSKFLELRDQKIGIVNVIVKSAVELTDGQKAKMKENFEKVLNKRIRFSFTIDPSVVGGFVAKVGDTVYDASLKHQLEILKKRFLTGSASLN